MNHTFILMSIFLSISTMAGIVFAAEMGILDPPPSYRPPVITILPPDTPEPPPPIIPPPPPVIPIVPPHGEDPDLPLPPVTVPPTRHVTPPTAIDPDPNTKGGGKDPIVLEGWSYIEPGNGYKCSNSPNPFDYDNDGFPEHMCYWYSNTTRILFNNHSNDKLINGTNFMPPFTHIWTDRNSNIFIDKGELTPIEDPQLTLITKYPEGKKLQENGNYAYCKMHSLTMHELAYCTQPTYWMTMEWMNK